MDGGYESTDGELDTDNEDEHELGRWLKQLDEPVEYNSSTRKRNTPNATPTRSISTRVPVPGKINGCNDGVTTYQSTNISASATDQDLELVDFDSILGDLNALDQLFEADNTEQAAASTKPTSGPTSGRPRSTARTSAADPFTDFDSCDAVLRNALLELDSIVGSAPDAVQPVVNGVWTAGTAPVNGSTIVVPPAAYFQPGTGVVGVPNGQRERPEPTHQQVRLSNRRPSATSISTTGSSELSVKDECSSPETTSQNGSVKMTSKTSQTCIQIHSPDGASNKVMVDETTTAGRLCELLMKKRNVPLITKWIIIEHLPDLFMERRVESHELIIDVVGNWNKECVNNKLLFVESNAQYAVFSADDMAQNPSLPIKLEGQLYVKSEGKKVWKKMDLMIQSTGLYCRPAAGKGKSEVTCLQNITDSCVYIAVGWRKKYKSPTEYGISLKPPLVQSKSPKLIKYICAEDENTFSKWLNALRRVKYGSLLHSQANKISRTVESRQLSNAPVSSPVIIPVDRQPATPPVNGSDEAQWNGLSTATLQRRKGSLVPALPISTQTTRQLSQQTRSTVCAIKDITEDGAPGLFRPASGTLPRSNVDRNVTASDLPPPRSMATARTSIGASNSSLDFPSPPPNAVSTPIAGFNGNILSPTHQPPMPSDKKKPVPPPTAKKLVNGALASPAVVQHHVPSVDRFEEPKAAAEPQRTPSIGKSGVTSIGSSPQHGSPARSKPAPPPPKRSESTRLTSPSFSNVNNPNQTKTFIMNLDRVIELKKCNGSSGLSNLPVPLPPRPTYVDVPSYLDTDDLPPPPAELLEGLKQMRIQTGVLIASPYMRR